MGPLPNGNTPWLIQYLYMGVIDPITTEPQVLGAHPPGLKGPVKIFSNRHESLATSKCLVCGKRSKGVALVSTGMSCWEVNGLVNGLNHPYISRL